MDPVAPPIYLFSSVFLDVSCPTYQGDDLVPGMREVEEGEQREKVADM